MNDMYYCPTCRKMLDLTEIDSCMNTPNEITDYCLKCKSQVIRFEEPDIYYTNADYLRGVNDENLAEFLLHKVKCTGCNAEHCDEKFCLTMMKEWIQRPYEE